MRRMRATELALLIAVLAAPGSAAPAELARLEQATPVSPTSTSTPTSTPTPASTPTATPDEPAAAPSGLDGRPGSAIAEKIAQGDLAYDSGDVRGALFAYQDAVYLAPSSAAARVKLGRAYLALRYPAQAQAQAEQALALDAGSADARRLLDDALAGRIPQASTATAPVAPPAVATASSAGGPQAPAAPPLQQVHVYRLTPEPAASTPRIVPAALAAPDTGRDATAAERYRAGVELIARREFARAIVELDGAIQQDQRLGVAYAARASARFGLGRHREAAQDYVSALELDPGLGTPLYGLAECYRLAGDRRAVELYRRYAASRAADVREDLRTLAVRRAAENVVH